MKFTFEICEHFAEDKHAKVEKCDEQRQHVNCKQYSKKKNYKKRN